MKVLKIRAGQISLWFSKAAAARTASRQFALLVMGCCVGVAAVSIAAAEVEGPPTKVAVAVKSAPVAPSAPAVAAAAQDVGPDLNYTETPAWADDFVNAIGMNTHFNYSGQYQTLWPQSRDWLVALGVRHIRDAPTTKTEGLIPDGIRLDTGLAITDTADIIQSKLLANPLPEAIEGANEYDNSGDSDWAAKLKAQQIVIWNTVKHNSAHPEFAAITVLGPPLQNPSKANQIGDISAYMDYGNMHDGTCSFNPETTNSAQDMRVKAADLKPEIGTHLIWVTEQAGTDDSSQTNYCSIADATIATKYDLRAYAFRWGDLHMPHTYRYEFQDSGQVKFGNEGIVNSNGVKVGYTALKNMIALLVDKGTKPTLASVSYTITGATTNVYHTLLEKRDGSHWLVIWIAGVDWDTTLHQGKPIVVPPQTVSLHFPSTQHFMHLNVFDSNWAISESSISAANNTATFSVTDNLTFVYIPR